jgi:putative flippase GtrA
MKVIDNIAKTYFRANHAEVTRFSKFLVVGTIGFIIDLGLLNLLHLGFGLVVLVSNALSFSAALTSNFLWNRYWTYPDSRTKTFVSQYIQFAGVNVLGLAINTGVLWLTLPWATHLVGTLGYNLSKVIATLVVLFWNFFINRYWTYNDVD